MEVEVDNEDEDDMVDDTFEVVDTSELAGEPIFFVVAVCLETDCLLVFAVVLLLIFVPIKGLCITFEFASMVFVK